MSRLSDQHFTMPEAPVFGPYDPFFDDDEFEDDARERDELDDLDDDDLERWLADRD